MRIKVKGDCTAAKVLRGYLEEKGNCRIVDKVPDYSVYLTRDDTLEMVTVDSIDCDLERFAINQMYEKGVPEFRLKRAGGVQNDNEIHISYPGVHEEAVELGLYRALTHHDWKREPKLIKGGIRRAAAVALWLGLVLLGSIAHTDELPLYFVRPLPKFYFQVNFPIIRVMGTDGTLVRVGDSVNSAVRVNVIASSASGGTVVQGAGAGAATNYWNDRITDGTNFIPFPTALAGAGGFKVECLSGCGGAASFADAAAFTFGTTSIGNMGAVVDDVGTNTVAENSAGAPRMNTNRILYFNPRNNAGTELATAGNPFRIDPTGTTTQPVSGTVAISNSFLLDATYTGRMPAGASPADNESNTSTSLSRIGNYLFLFDGATWDRAPGDSANGAKVQNATAANFNNRPDTSGATAAAVPARADYIGGNDGTNLIGAKTTSAANLTLGATNLTGSVFTEHPCEWSITHTPALATKATASRAANASGRHVAKFYVACFGAGATGNIVLPVNIRDGATGAGTVLWTIALAMQANGSNCFGQEITLIGTTNTAMTIEFTVAGAANTQQVVSLCGYDTN